MSIEHKLIPDAQLHESKGVASAATNSVYVADGFGSGAWRKLTEAEMEYGDKLKNRFGWNDVADSLYTSAAPLSIPATTRTLLTNNGAGAQSDTTRLGALWTPASSQFLINDLNASYVIRVAARVKAAAVAGTPYMLKFELESANGPAVIVANDQMIKGGGYENAVALSLPIYIGSFINNRTLKLFVTADTAITVYNIGFTIQRTYKET